MPWSYHRLGAGVSMCLDTSMDPMACPQDSYSRIHLLVGQSIVRQLTMGQLPSGRLHEAEQSLNSLFIFPLISFGFLLKSIY